MKPITLTLAVVLLCAACSAPAAAQNPRAQVEKIRQQIAALQQQLDGIDRGGKSHSRVTQIGSNRLRIRNPALTVRIYDLGDLFAIAPPYAARHGGELSKEGRLLFPLMGGGPQGSGGFGGGGLGGGGFFNVRNRPQHLPAPRNDVLKQTAGAATTTGGSQTSLDDLIKVIEKIISPDIWQDAGGPASIAKLGNALLISADGETHEQIDELLNLFRKRWGTLRTISVRAYWLPLSDTQLAGVLAKPAAGKPQPGDVRAFGLVDEAAWQKQLAQLGQREGQQQPGYRAAVTCYNGQTVHTVSGGQSLAVTQIRPVLLKGDDEKPQGRVAYRPEMSTIHEGVALQVTPIANVAGETVLLDVHSRVCKRVEAAIQAPPAVHLLPAGSETRPREVVAAIDRPRLAVQRLSTTLRAPVDRTMLVGGMTFSAEPKAANKTPLYLFVRVTVQELRNDLPQPGPAAKKAGAAAPPTKPQPETNKSAPRQ